jgi:hypothetical protein
LAKRKVYDIANFIPELLIALREKYSIFVECIKIFRVKLNCNEVAEFIILKIGPTLNNAIHSWYH